MTLDINPVFMENVAVGLLQLQVCVYYSRMLAGLRHRVCISLPNTAKTKRSKQQRPESPTVTFTWYACKYKVHKLHQRYILPLMDFMYLVFTRMLGESYHRRLRPLLSFVCYVIRALINSLVC